MLVPGGLLGGSLEMSSEVRCLYREGLMYEGLRNWRPMSMVMVVSMAVLRWCCRRFTSFKRPAAHRKPSAMLRT